MDLSGKIQIVGKTDVGRRRDHNEDSIGSEPGRGLAVLADGMGGYKAGEVASAIAVNSILGELAETLESLEAGEDENGYGPETVAIRAAVVNANRAIYRTAQNQPQYKGMGTTLVMALLYDDRMTVAHVGDSRMYRFRDGILEQVTIDHTLMQELIDRGFYTPEEARNSRNKNLVTRALGIDEQVTVDVQEDVVLKDDILLLCSDGLNDMVEDKEICLTLKNFSDNLEAAAEELISKANENGGNDNISVILVKALESFAARKGWLQRFIDWF